jgi:hypothetical protein
MPQAKVNVKFVHLVIFVAKMPVWLPLHVALASTNLFMVLLNVASAALGILQRKRRLWSAGSVTSEPSKTKQEAPRAKTATTHSSASWAPPTAAPLEKDW